MDGCGDRPDGLIDCYPAFQKLGSVAAKEGRLITFPSTLQYQVEPFKLVDKTKPGHQRFLVIWLVDPNYRVCSTRNVPPQRHDWWAYGIERKASLSAQGLPQELVDHILEYAQGNLMGREEARQLRLELLKERKENYEMMEEWIGKYGF
jgi:hypothetical protein